MLAAILANDARRGVLVGDVVWQEDDRVTRARRQRKLEQDRKLKSFLEDTYDRVMGIAPEKAQKVVKPFVKAKVDKTQKVPQIRLQIDYSALMADMRAVRAMLDLYTEYLEEEDIAMLLLLDD